MIFIILFDFAYVFLTYFRWYLIISLLAEQRGNKTIVSVLPIRQ